MTSALLIALALGALAFGALVSSLSFALRDFSFRRLEEIADRNGGLERLTPIVKDPGGHALALGAFRTLCAVAVITIALVLLPVFGVEEGAASLHLNAIVLAVSIAISTVLIYFCMAVIPHSLADHAGERLIHAFAPVIRIAHALAAPLMLLRAIDTVVERLSGDPSRTDEQWREEEILSAVSEGEHEGTVKEAEREMIEAVVEFWSTSVEEIMTPRTEIEGFELTDDLEFIRSFIAEAGHSRIPVYEGDLDHIVGILYAKDLLDYLGKATDEFRLKPILRQATFVPEGKLIAELLTELQRKKVHMAIVLDEYGGTAGLVTVEDIIEEIVGEIQDEHEPEDEAPPEILVDLDARAAEIDARAYIEDANDALEPLHIELPEHEDYDTVGGYILWALGHIPVVGESFSRDHYDVIILEAEPTRIHRIRVRLAQDSPAHGNEVPAEQSRPS